MGTVNATLLSDVPNTNWVNATFPWVTAKRSTSRVTAKRSTSWVISKCARRFSASRGVLFHTHPEEVGGKEAKQ
jgi:hypothetical protein